MLTVLYIYLGLTHVLIPILIVIGALYITHVARKDNKNSLISIDEKQKFRLHLALYLLTSLFLGAILTPVVILIIYVLFKISKME